MIKSSEDPGKAGGDGREDALVIHNPRSRRGRRAARVARAALERAGVRARWIGIADLAGVPVLPARAIAIGGDGTVSAVAEWILRLEAGGTGGPTGDRGPPTVLGIVPAGTGNNLAISLGIPLEAGPAVEIAGRGAAVRRIDAIRYRPDPAGTAAGSGSTPADRVLVQSGQLGFPADINARFHALRRHVLSRWALYPLGRIVYEFLALGGIAARRLRERWGAEDRGLHLRAVLPGEVVEDRVLAVFIGNDTRLGGEFRPCPLARLDDGLIDLCWIRAGIRDSYLGIFRDVTRGAHVERRKGAVEYRQTPGPIEIALDAPAPFLADGDIWVSASGYRLDLLPGAVRVAVGR